MKLAKQYQIRLIKGLSTGSPNVYSFTQDLQKNVKYTEMVAELQKVYGTYNLTDAPLADFEF